MKRVIGVGVDLVHVPGFAEQLAQPGTQMERAFTAGERADARERPLDADVHLAARWAAKEALIKAWSTSIYGLPPVVDERVHHLIEVVTDAWGRPRLRLHGAVGEHLDRHDLSVSLSHDGDYATAYVVLGAPWE